MHVGTENGPSVLTQQLIAIYLFWAYHVCLMCKMPVDKELADGILTSIHPKEVVCGSFCLQPLSPSLDTLGKQNLQRLINESKAVLQGRSFNWLYVLPDRAVNDVAT